MMIRPVVKQLGQQTAIYGIGNVLSKLAAFLLIPVYTRYLAPSEVGILALLEMTEFFLISILPMGIVNALWRYLPDAGGSERRKVISTAFFGMQGIGLIILTLLVLNKQTFSSVLNLGEQGPILFLIMCLNVFLFTGGQFILWMHQYDQKPIQYLVFSLGYFIGVLLLTVYFVVVLNQGIYGVLIGKMIALGILFVASSGYVFSTALVMPRFPVLIKMLGYGAPLILLGLVTPVLTFSDRYFLKVFVGLEQIGIYSIAYKLGMLINMVLVVPLQRGWVPMMYRIGVEKGSHDVYRDLMFYYAVVGSLLFLALSFFAADVLRVVATPTYLPGVYIVPIITLAYYVNGFRRFFIAGAILKDKTPRLALAGGLGIATNLVLNYFLIRWYGVSGAAWATLISYAALVVFVYLVSQKLARIDWGWGRLFKLGIIVAGTFTAVHQVQLRYQAWQELAGLAGIALFVAVLMLTGTVGYREIKGMKSLVGSIKSG